MRADNSRHLADAARRRAEQTMARARQALADMQNGGEPITITAVAARARVSRAWLYSQAELRQQIAALSSTVTKLPKPSPAPASDASLRHRLTLANQRLRELSHDNQQLRDQIAALHGQLRAAPAQGKLHRRQCPRRRHPGQPPNRTKRPKINVARRSSRTSARSLRSAADSSLVTPGLMPPSTSACEPLARSLRAVDAQPVRICMKRWYIRTVLGAVFSWRPPVARCAPGPRRHRPRLRSGAPGWPPAPGSRVPRGTLAERR